MSTTAQIVTAWQAAGARYAAAVTELRAAWIDLAAHDGALANQKIGYPNRPVRSFGDWPEPRLFVHPIYSALIPGHWQSEANAARNAIIAAHPTPDEE